MTRRSIFLFFVISILFSYCTTKGKFAIENGYQIDSSFKLKDSLNEIICLKYNLGDSVKPNSVNFHYFIKENHNWVLRNKFDSLECWRENELLTDHADFNNDDVADFVFLAKQGIHGANFWDNIILYKPNSKSFIYLRGSKEICAPWFDKKKKNIIGVNTFGGNYALSDYIIDKDSVIETSREVWRDDTLIRKIK